MGETVTFTGNGESVEGYLAVPDNGTGYGVMVVQEWWGLVPQIKRTCDRLAAEGFVALAPDLYRGDIAEHTEMDKAGELMSTLPPDRAAADMEGAVDYLRALPSVQNDRIGVVGYCMGGMLAMIIGAKLGNKIGAVVPHYGAPLGDNEPDWSNLTAPVRGHFAENDDFFPPQAVKQLETKLRDMGKDVHLDVYPNTGHAFCNEENALGTHDERATAQSWRSTIGFLKNELS
jgi:carboxymethylenebutenolidase